MAGVEDTSTNQALVLRLLDELGKLMWAMVWDVANHDRWLLVPEEVHAELCLEMVKTVSRYSSKPYDELKRLCVTCMRNRVHDLATSQYLTNRRAEAKTVSLDGAFDAYQQQHSDAVVDEFVPGRADGYNGYSAFTTVDNMFDVEEFCYGMTEDAKALVKEVLNPGERTIYFLWLTEQRKKQANLKGFWSLTITPQIMARSMGWSWDRLKIAWGEVSQAIVRMDFDGGLVLRDQEEH